MFITKYSEFVIKISQYTHTKHISYALPSQNIYIFN
jgi:hypothetical protein